MRKLLSRKEYEEYVKNIPKDVCQLCFIENQITLGESVYWYWIANISPYWKWHTMLVPKRHETDMDSLSQEEFLDYQNFHRRVVRHLRDLNLVHDDGKEIDQFITMVRSRFNDVPNGSTYYKPDHLHIHIVPDKEGVERFVLDESAKDVDIANIALR